jgi:hypothetical protein
MDTSVRVFLTRFPFEPVDQVKKFSYLYDSGIIQSIEDLNIKEVKGVNLLLIYAKKIIFSCPWIAELLLLDSFDVDLFTTKLYHLPAFLVLQLAVDRLHDLPSEYMSQLP